MRPVDERFDQLFIGLGAAAWAVLLVRVLRVRRAPVTRLLNLQLLAPPVVALVVAALAPRFVGYATFGALWLASVPYRILARLAAHGRYQGAAALAGLLPDARHQARYYRALALRAAGRLEDALAELDGLAASATLGRLARLTKESWQHRWSEVRALAERDGAPEPSAVLLWLRALGETAGAKTLLAALARNERRLAGGALAQHRIHAWLFALAFGGRTRLVEELCAGPLRSAPPGVADFWLATSELAAGDEVAAHARLERGAELVDPVLRASYALRLAGPRPPTEALGQEGERLLAAIEHAVRGELRYGRAHARLGAAWATLALAAANVAAFAVQGAEGGWSDAVLMRLGAYEPERVAAGAWWRIVTAQFLHAHPAHLALNVLGLLWLGPYVERAVGHTRFVLLYAGAGLAGVATIHGLIEAGTIAPAAMVGASVAIMGLIGATCAILLRGREEGAAAARRQLVPLALIVVAQLILDFWLGWTSFPGHAFGAVYGFALAVPLVFGRRRGALRALGIAAAAWGIAYAGSALQAAPPADEPTHDATAPRRR